MTRTNLRTLWLMTLLGTQACAGQLSDSDTGSTVSDDASAVIVTDAGDAAPAVDPSDANAPADANAAIEPDAVAPVAPCPAELYARGRCPNLSSYELFVVRDNDVIPTAGNIAYEVISPLFSDSATKHRFFRLPPGGRIGYEADGAWRFPVGTILSKNFQYPVDERNPALGQRRIETRLLVRTASGFVGATYVWNAEQTDATLDVDGAAMPVAWLDQMGAPRAFGYRVPDMNQCTRCHGEDLHPLGLRTRQLDRAPSDAPGSVNQIEAWARLGMFDSVPAPYTERRRLTRPSDQTASIEQRARSYLESNCAHCHNPEGFARHTGLFLGIDVTDTASLGACRTPNYAQDFGGRHYDVVPGSPEESILVFRMNAVHDGERMPLGSQLADPVGVDVVSRWIASMAPRVCP